MIDSDGDGRCAAVITVAMVMGMAGSVWWKAHQPDPPPPPPAPPVSWVAPSSLSTSTWQDVAMDNGPNIKRVPMGAGWLVYAEQWRVGDPGSGGGPALTWVPDTAPIVSVEAGR